MWIDDVLNVNVRQIAMVIQNEWTTLMWAALQGQQKADVNLQDIGGRTALYQAAWKGHLKVVNSLLQAGANVNLQNKRKRTALLTAGLQGHLEVVKALILTRADVNLHDVFGRTALHNAAWIGHLKVVNELLNAGAVVNQQANNGDTALHKATEEGRVQVVNVLLLEGADVNMKTKAGRTALHKAADKGHLEMVIALLRAKPDVNLQDKGGLTALRMAAENGHFDVVNALLVGAPEIDVNRQDKDGWTALDKAKPNMGIKTLLKEHKGIHGTGSSYFGRVYNIFSTAAAKSTPTFAATSVPTTPTAATGSFSELSHSLNGQHPQQQDEQQKEQSATTSPPIESITKIISSNTLPVAQSSPPPTTSAAAVFTEEDRAALQSFTQASAQFLHVHGRLNELLLTVAAHERTLQQLVGKSKECPSLFWFYPLKREFRDWLSNPTKCLFQDTLMMVVVCPLTLCVVQCGPEGVGWEVSVPKKWVEKWGPAIMVSIYVMQVAVLAGRVVGIPLPQLPSVTNLTGLSSPVFGLNDAANQENTMKCLTEFASTTAAVLKQQSPEMKVLLSSIQKHGQNEGQPLAEDKVKLVTDDAYKSIHTFLTSGKNAKLGKLEDQLRGRMERVMAPNGDIDWVSVQGKELWLEKHKRFPELLSPASSPRLSMPTAAAKTHTFSSLLFTEKSRSTINTDVVASQAPQPQGSWLAPLLLARGVSGDQLQQCETKLVVNEGFNTEALFAATSPDLITLAYLSSIGISAMGLQQQLIGLHRKLRYQHYPATDSPHLNEAATFTSEEKSAVLQMQTTIQDLTSQLSKLRAAAAVGVGSTPLAASNNTSWRSLRSGGDWGLALQEVQATANTINPRTRLPYTVEDLSEEIFRLTKEVARHDRDIGIVAATTEERLDDIQQCVLSGKEVNLQHKLRGWNITIRHAYITAGVGAMVMIVLAVVVANLLYS